MACKIRLSCLLVIACILIHETTAQSKACSDPIIEGKITRLCDAISRHYGYESSSNTCVSFRYTGCGQKTENNFSTIEDCEKTCVTEKHIQGSGQENLNGKLSIYPTWHILGSF